MVTSTGLVLSTILTWDCPSSTSVRDSRARPNAGFKFNVQKWPVQASGGAFKVNKTHFDTKTDNCQGGQKSDGGASTSLTLRRRGVI